MAIDDRDPRQDVLELELAEATATTPAVLPAEPADPGLRLGEVRFGRDPDGPGDEVARYLSGDRLEWRVRFSSPAAAARVAIVTSRRLGQGWERAISGHELWLPHPGVTEYSGWLGPGAYDGPGRYVVRFIRDATVLAEGEFDLLASGESGPDRHH
jgi:hypothetical protein